MIAAEEGLVAVLLADPVLSPLVGKRIEPQTNSQDTAFPRMTYQRISTRRLRHLGGRSKLAHLRIQVNCFGRTESDAKQAAAAVVNALDDPAKYQSTAAGWKFQAIWVEDERDGYSPDRHAADTGVFQVSLDVIVWHNEV